MKKPVTIEPFHIVRARKIRQETIRRWALGMALGAILFLGIGSLAGCAAPPEGVIARDMGGPVLAYALKYADWERRGVAARVDGACGSACTLVLRNRRLCYRRDAVFLFHGVSRRGEYDARASEAFKAAMPEGVRRWAEESGAFAGTRTVSISGRELAAIDGRACA